jgi:hypothetical protein
MVEPDRPQMTIRLMRIASRIAKTTNTRSEYLTRTAFYGKNGRTKAHQCCIIPTLPVLYYTQVYPKYSGLKLLK